MPKKLSLELKWKRLAEEAKAEAAKLPYGPERDALLKKARQLETAMHVNGWISSPGLRPPVDLTRFKE
ncbi:hypothetical protein HNQ36_005114 [Afipia massiliensis]|uniref:Uncharacterized protein n=1 Tax=Afipia massiliensis TaxID=211460 RepID=A0A840N4Y0_9BRAD|nr:hypothetical protein [Afipia massiliensis]MBB5055103.1 hypothetical protein [Afipia massiliensis]